MLKLRDYLAYALATGSGLSVWIVIPAITGDPEAWNSSLYWTTAMPLITLECGILGYFVPERWWLWGIVVTSAQVIVMIAHAPTSNLLPPAVAILFVLSIPYLVSGFIGGRISKRRS